MNDPYEALASRAFTPADDGPLSDQLFTFLRDAIRRGDLVPGQRLVEDTIASATNVSRTPVREALRKLVATGLAASGGRGLVVARISTQQLQQMWEVSHALWLTVARLAAERRSAADLAEFRFLIEAAKAGRGVGGDPQQLNERLRNCLLRAAGNPYLTEAALHSVGQAEALVDLSAARQEANAILQEDGILAALEERDGAALETIYSRYLEATLTAWLLEMHRRADGRLADQDSANSPDTQRAISV
ncbi:MAG: GntR family transcriptional regulator [Solirubrobacteraceae bacterium]